jgi:acylphosphatase
MHVNAKITIKGIVQGVGYRWFADRNARKFDLKGFVENLPNGNVFCEVEGEEVLINDFIKQLRIGPRGGNVYDVYVEFNKPHFLFIGFTIKA